jgi:NTE family protein
MNAAATRDRAGGIIGLVAKGERESSGVSPHAAPGAGKVAFVLGGGGHLGACEVGMLRALLEAGIRPEFILGTSVGAVNGAIVAGDCSVAAVERLSQQWCDIEEAGVFNGSVLGRLGTLARSRTHLHAPGPLRAMLERGLSVSRIEELPVPFQCVAASIERASEHWFTSGSVVDAVIASSSVPGLLPPAEIDGEHFVDGGIVNSIPVGRAVALGASTIYVLQVGRVEQPLEPPAWPWEAGLVAFEIARRHRFASDMAALPEGVSAHVLPTGAPAPPAYKDLSQLRYRDLSRVSERIERAYEASRRYLAERVGAEA